MFHSPEQTIAALKECEKGETRECKKKCPYYTKDASCLSHLRADSLLMIVTLQNSNKLLEEKVSEQRTANFQLQLMYDWALERLRSNNLNDRAHFQAWLNRKGFGCRAADVISKEMLQYKPIDFGKPS